MRLKPVKSINNIEVIMAVHNGEKYIREQIDSILNQTLKPNKIIFGLDSTTDGSLTIIKSLTEDIPIKSEIHLVDFKNPSLTFNFLENISQGEIIFFADQDDIWDLKKIEMCIREFNQGADMVIHNASLFSEINVNLNKTLWSSKFFRKDNSLRINLLNKTIAFGTCMAFRKDIKLIQSQFPKGFGHDNFKAILYMMMRKKIFVLDREFTKYRQHTNQITKKNNSNNVQILDKIKIDIRSFIFMRYCITLYYKKEGFKVDYEFSYLLKRKIRHLIKRKILQNKGNTFINIFIILKDYKSYKLFSNGIKSQLKDIYLLIKKII
tara:strand:+ start:109 stop:1074 length:966 start_codon:yes stop_codon:yes gene_type:complete